MLNHVCLSLSNVLEITQQSVAATVGAINKKRTLLVIILVLHSV